MLDNPSIESTSAPIAYPTTDSKLSFNQYIINTKAHISATRPDLAYLDTNTANKVIEANSPYELYPPQPIRAGEKLKYGALLLHGLLDCPFSLRDIGDRLQAKGVLCRSLLLPGHGTTPSDLFNVSYQDWVDTVNYGIQSLRKEVNQIYLVGYSTGAALSIYHALQDKDIAGIILLAPAVQIKAPEDLIVAWRYLKQWLGRHNLPWLYHSPEIDYAKYCSIPFNPVTQVSKLTAEIRQLRQTHDLPCPVFLAVSREDETISSTRAIDFFSHHKHPDSQLLLYTSIEHRYPDKRIHTRLALKPQLNINHFSHVAIPFAPSNPHYGAYGDFPFASRIDSQDYVYGAYNRIEVKILNSLHKLSLLNKQRRALTYNPDFDYMITQIERFVFGA